MNIVASVVIAAWAVLFYEGARGRSSSLASFAVVLGSLALAIAQLA